MANFAGYFDLADYTPLSDAPQEWINKAYSIFAETDVNKKLKRFVAKLIFDSWAMPQPAGVRGTSQTGHRRIRFEKEDVVFDIRFEHQEKDWSFIGQIISESDSDFVLNVEKTAVYADNNGLFQWSGKKPPQNMSLRSSDSIIELPELNWKKSR